MRGKLRDKRVAVKPDALKRELQEKRRISKRDNRVQFQLEQQFEEDDELDLTPNDDNEETLARIMPKA